jgi:predicted RNA binding protein YcfA (HicA-like mRNA interferase family)
MAKFTPQHWKTVEAVFLSAGFKFDRQEGSHRSDVKPGVARPVVIPAYREVPVFVIGTISKPPEFRGTNTLPSSKSQNSEHCLISHLRSLSPFETIRRWLKSPL